MTDQAEAPPQTTPSRKKRSPSYPGIDLELAIQRARELWEQEHHYATPVQTVLGHWGYGAKSGGGFAALAALKTFGLVADEGNGASRMATLTRLAQDIITSEDAAERAALIQTAALTPTVHKDVWAQWHDKLPSDQAMTLFLIRERGFTASGAGELLSEWKRTMTFAKLTSGTASVPPDDEDKPDRNQTGGTTELTPPTMTADRKEAPQQTPAEKPAAAPVGQDPPAPPARSETLQVPYAPRKYALIQATFPMTESEWTQMLAVLTAMKPSLIEPAAK